MFLFYNFCCCCKTIAIQVLYGSLGQCLLLRACARVFGVSSWVYLSVCVLVIVRLWLCLYLYAWVYSVCTECTSVFVFVSVRMYLNLCACVCTCMLLCLWHWETGRLTTTALLLCPPYLQLRITHGRPYSGCHVYQAYHMYHVYLAYHVYNVYRVVSHG